MPWLHFRDLLDRYLFDAADALSRRADRDLQVMRNIGSSIGVLVVVASFTRGHHANHALLAEHVTPCFSKAILAGYISWKP